MLAILLFSCRDDQPAASGPPPAPLPPFTTTPTTPPPQPIATVAGEEPVLRLRSAGDTDGDGSAELLAFGDHGALLVGTDGVRARFGPEEVVAPAGDVDGDGRADLALITADLRMGVWLGPQSGTPALDLDWTPGSGRYPWSLADTTADVDGDGLSDVVSVVYEDYGDCFLGVNADLVPFTGWNACTAGLVVLADPAHGAPSGPVLSDYGGLSLLYPAQRPVDPLELVLGYEAGLRAVGDLDGDGAQDAAVVGWQGRVSAEQVLLDPGGASARVIEVRGPAATAAQVAGRFDLDGDGAIDVATTWWDAVGYHVAVAYGPWEGQADVDLEVRVADPAALTGAVEAVDFDTDGVPDIAVGTTDGLAVYSGAAIVADATPAVPLPGYAPVDACAEAPAAARSLDPSATAPLAGALTAADAGIHVVGDYGWPSSIRVGDFDGDGADDLALGNERWIGFDNEHLGAVHVLRELSMGESLLAEGSQVIPGGQPPYDAFGALIGAADVDGDGADDLFAGAPWNGEAWLLAGGPSGLACPQEADPAAAQLAVLPGPDLDGDGVGELVVRQLDDRLAVLASPAFTTTRTELVLPQFSSLRADPVLVDWDGDGIAEAVVPIDNEGDDVWVLDLGVTGTVAMADAAIARRTHANGDHSVAVAGDIDGDGTEDVWAAYPRDGSQAGSVPGRIYGLGGPDAEADLAATALVTFEGDTEAYLGTWVAGGGDTDGDGAPELLAAGDGLRDGAWLFRDLSPGSHVLDEATATFSAGADGAWLEGPVVFADLDQDSTDDVVLSVREGMVGSLLVYFGGAR